jgi:hypothetical protein
VTQTYWDPAAQMAWLSSPDLATWVADALGRHGTFPGVHTVTVQHRPGAGVSALLQVSAPDTPEPLIIGLTTELLDPATLAPAPPGYEPRFAAGPGGPVILWPHPHDPRMPGLPAAVDPHAVQTRWGHGRRVRGVTTRAYRPLRRAVLVVDLERSEDTDPGALFLKVLHSRADELAQRHLMLAAAGLPVPRLRLPDDAAGPTDAVRDGTIALEVASGRSLATALAAQEAHPISTADLIAVLDRMPQECLRLGRKDSWTDRIEDHALAARAAFPSLTPEIDAVLQRVRHGVATYHPGTLVPTHGDLYEANIFVHDSRVSGLLDLDGVGPGYRVDDLACLVAHLAVLPSLDHRYRDVPKLLRWITPTLAADVARHSGDPRGLWVRSASVVLTLIAGMPGEGHDDPTQAARERLALAGRLLDRAERGH